MKIDSERFRVNEGDKVRLKKWPTRVEHFYESNQQYRQLLQDHVEKLSSLQQLFYAADSYALLLIFQAMDAAGKDVSFATSCRESILKAARSSASNILVQRNWIMIFSGGPQCASRNAAESASSIGLITKRCSLSVSIRKSCETRASLPCF